MGKASGYRDRRTCADLLAMLVSGGLALILASRLALVDILPAGCLLAGLPTLAAGLLALGILVDRVAFYGFASQHTTEAEVGWVEQVIAS